jgi:hypothetical protein
LDTRSKLEEARHFLKEFIRTQKEPDTYKPYFNLSAFLSAWRSVLDVMLYDFAEYYTIGLNREDKMYPRDFWLVSKVQSKKQALEFLDWWNKKRAKLEKNELWRMRHIIVHRGYPEISHVVYVPPSLSSGTTIAFHLPEEIPTLETTITIQVPKEISTEEIEHRGLPIKYSDLPKKCKKAFTMIESIVVEAEKEFEVSLR